jgi:hypothetical protein
MGVGWITDDTISRTLMNTYGHLIDHAIEDLTRNVVEDGELVQILAGQKPSDWAN